MKTYVLPCPAICIDNSKRPPVIPKEHWPELGEIYTAIDMRLLSSNNTGIALKEIQIPKESKPFEMYGISRFMPLDQEDINAMTSNIQQLLHESGIAPS